MARFEPGKDSSAVSAAQCCRSTPMNTAAELAPVPAGFDREFAVLLPVGYTDYSESLYSAMGVVESVADSAASVVA